MKLPPRSRRAATPEQGYILIILILFVALLAIGLSVVVPEITQQIKRDREEELIHRGVQYSRAIKHYVKKFGRYPTRIEDLEDTNNLRFLRKRYKDPITGKDFKILHLGDVQMSFSGGIAGATSASAMTAGAPGTPSGAFGNSTFGGGNSTFGGGGGAFGSSNSTFGGGNSAFGGNTGGFGGGAFGGSSTFGGGTAGGIAAGTTGATPGNPSAAAPGTDASQTNPGANPDQTAGDATGAQAASGQPGAGPGATQGTTQGQGNNPVFGGGPMVGVVSTSKDKSIRIFAKKEHYNEWQFIYDPSTDRGGLLATPNQPGMQTAVAPTVQGTTGVQGGPQSGSQQSSPFGSPSSSFGFSGGQQQPGGMQPTQQQPQPQFPPDQGP